MTAPRILRHLVWLLVTAGVATAVQMTPSNAQYRLGVGDVVELSIAGIPELKQRATVNIDGDVIFPIIGQTKAAGLSLTDLRREVGKSFSAKFFYQRTADGREITVTIRPEEAGISLVEYRPVYLNGDVSKPGEQPFRPQMTVRQAVAVAGGYEMMRYRVDNPFLAAVELKTEYDTLWTDFAKEQVRIARLQAELNGKSTLDLSNIPREPVSSPTLERMIKLEADHLSAREADFQKERVSLKLSLNQANRRLEILLDQQQKEERGTIEDAQEFERVRSLFEKGTIPITRVNDARRATLLSSTRSLQTTAEAARVEREASELNRKLEKVDDQRRLDALRELQDSRAKAATLFSKIQGVSEKLLYVGAIRSQLVRGGAEPKILIFRKEGSTQISAGEDTQLLPGDVIEVSLQIGAEVLPPASSAGD